MSCCGGGIVVMFLWALVLAVLLVGAVVLVRILWDRAGGRDGSERTDDRNAERVLEERFARGEIDREEFEDRSRILDSS